MKMNCMQKPNVDDSWIPLEGEIINMIVVDIFDKRIGTYAYVHRFQKWGTIFIYLLKMAISNSYFVFLEIRKNQRNQITLTIGFG